MTGTVAYWTTVALVLSLFLGSAYAYWDHKSWVILTLLTAIAIIGVASIITFVEPVADNIIEDDVDVILVDRGRNRSAAQIRCIDRYMSWIRKVHLFTDDDSLTSSTPDTLQVHALNERSLEQVFLSIHDNADVADRFLFFGDTTFPRKGVPRSVFTNTNGQRRMCQKYYPDFQAFSLTNYLESDIQPVLVVEKDDIDGVTTVDDVILGLVFEDDVVYTPDLSQDVIVTSRTVINQKQLAQVTDSGRNEPLVTFHGDDEDIREFIATFAAS